MAFTTAPDWNDGIAPAAKLQQLSDAINERTPRVAGTKRVADVSTFTAETICDTVTAILTSGQTYGIFWYAQIQSTVAGDAAGIKIREDSVAGTQMVSQRIELADSGAGYPVAQYAEYTAASSGSKTFVGTAVRSVGTGNLTAAGSATQQANIFVVLVA